MTTITVTEWVSERDPLFVRSAILEGPTELGLIDTQFTIANALRLAADLLERGKPLTWIYITHPHLDHFNGVATFRHVFPAVQVYAQPAALAVLAPMVATRQAALGSGVLGGATNLPTESPRGIQAVPGPQLHLDGLPIDILTGPGDHPDSSVVWIPSARTVVAGDVVFAKTHAFTGDHRDIAGWIALVERIQALDPATVVVGHGPPAARHDAQVLAEQIRWLRDFQAAIAVQDAPAHVEATMTQSYPDYANDFIFAFSYGVAPLAAAT